jgi:2-methylcitrate dehydratase PrpD
MSDKPAERLGRRTFLSRAAMTAGAAGLAPNLVAAIPAVTAPLVATPAKAATAPAAPRQTGFTRQLAQYASALRYEDIPADARLRVKNTIIDTVAVILYGGKLPWSQTVIAHAKRTGPNGKSAILGGGGANVQAPSAALAHGTMAHAFELDNLTDPNSGSHPGAAMFSSGLAIAQERGLGGRDLVLAMTSGGEVMIRIGLAAKGSLEPRGFHAPGTTGPFGGAVTCGKLMQFDQTKMVNALGIAGSLSSGLLEFAHSKDGGMVKKLHLGRAAESGVLAASLAADGFDGPTTVIEGEAGYLEAFGTEHDFSELTKGLGRDYVSMYIMMKRFACHVTAHRPVEGILDLINEHKLKPEDVEAITLTGNERMASVNNIPAPPDVLLAQYSIPFSVGLAFYRNPIDPDSFDENVHTDRNILAMAAKVKMNVVPGQKREDISTTVAVTLKGGRTVTRRVTEFRGTPARPLDEPGMREKFMLMSKRFPRADMDRLYQRLQNIENERTLDWLTA